MLSFLAAVTTLLILLFMGQYLKPILWNVYSGEIGSAAPKESAFDYDLERYLNERTNLTEEQKARILDEAKNSSFIEGKREVNVEYVE